MTKESEAIENLLKFKRFFTEKARREPNNPFNNKWLEDIDIISKVLMETIFLLGYEKELILKALKKLFSKEYNDYVYGNLTPEERGYAEIECKRIEKLMQKLTNTEHYKLKILEEEEK